MPNIFKFMIIRRFLAHVLEIGSTFALTLVLLQVLAYVNNFMIQNGDFVTFLAQNTPNLGELNTQEYTQQSVNSIYQIIIGFTIFYFIYSSFNFFFTFSFLYPKNDFSANVFQRMFGFKKYEFGKKKMTHLQKALRMLFREVVLFASIYGFFAVLAIFRMRDFFELFNYLVQGAPTIQSVFFSLLALFVIFVLPALLLSIFSLYKSKGKQLFWDYTSSIALK